MLAIIAGSGFEQWDLMREVKEEWVSTPYGDTVFYRGTVLDREILFLPRHRVGHSIPPHRIPYRANLWALKKNGVKRIAAINAVGSLDRTIEPGELVLIDDFLDFTRSREHTFYDGEDGRVGHADMTRCYCPDWQETIQKAAAVAEIPLHTGGVYVATEGPRFETRAEICAYGRLGGTVVGMTGVPECPLAVELGICYGSIAYVTNYACGVAGSLHAGEISAVMEQSREKLSSLLAELVKIYRDDFHCSCDAEGCLL